MGTYVGVSGEGEVQAQILDGTAVHGELLHLVPLLRGAQLGVLLQLLLLVHNALNTQPLASVVDTYPLCWDQAPASHVHSGSHPATEPDKNRICWDLDPALKFKIILILKLFLL